MEVGIDSFAIAPKNVEESPAEALRLLLERIAYADQVGIDSFGIGEHHRSDFLDQSPAMILAAAAAITKRIKLTSAVTVLSAADPVRVFQNYATLDLLSGGRAEIVAGRGSFTDAFPLFGYDLADYNAVFKEKLELLLTLRDQDVVNWSGRFRPALHNQSVYPRPLQKKLPIWLGVGGTPASFIRAGELGLPLMIAVIGGQTHRFAPLVDLYRQAGKNAGHSPEDLKVGLHSLGYVAENTEVAIEDYFPGYRELFTKIGAERGFPAPTIDSFNAQNSIPQGALLVGSPEDVASKINHHSKALGGISKITFQMDVGISHEKLKKSFELIATKVKPLLKS